MARRLLPPAVPSNESTDTGCHGRCDVLLHWRLFQGIFSFEVAHRKRCHQLTTTNFLIAGLHGSLAQKVQFIFVQAALEKEIWSTIKWNRAYRNVRRLQARIVKATQAVKPRPEKGV